MPFVGLSGANAVAVWGDSNGNCYSRHSQDYGATWENAREIDAGAGYAGGPRIAIDGANAVAVWIQDTGSFYGIYRNYSSDSGASWTGAHLIQDNTEDAGDFDVSISGTTVFAVWAQRHDSTRRLYSDHSLDGGKTWHTDQMIEDNEGESARVPRVAVFSSGAVAVWQLRGNYEGNGVEIYSNFALISRHSQGVVGGEIGGVNKLKVSAPWLAVLSGLLVLGGTALIFSRRKRYPGK
jgi:hypothetical protein